jgi:Family of unknown function (DUF5681)
MAKFQPGRSGNPGGRPKAAYDLQALAKEQTAASLRTLVELRDNSSDDNIRMKAASYILDRAWAKPMQNVSQTGNTGFTLAQLIAYPGIERGEPITIEHRPKKLEQVK